MPNNGGAVYESRSQTETEQIACMLAANKAESGGVYCLSGPLGAGKTAFVKGFARGLGCNDLITSPTFTLMHVYECAAHTIYHFDLYRLMDDDAGDINNALLDDIGLGEYMNAGGICLIEWAECAAEYIKGASSGAVWVTMETDEKKDSAYRLINVRRRG